MIVATSAAVAAVARAATVSSLTSELAAISLSRSSCIRHRCSSAGSRSRAAETICSNASFSTMTARAAELDRIHSAWSAEEVS